MSNNPIQTSTGPDDALLAILAAHRITTLRRQSHTLRALGLSDLAATFDQWAAGLQHDLGHALTTAPARVTRRATIGIWHGGTV